MRRVKVAAIQATSINGRLQRNLDNAEALVARAAAQGAELVVCPEFLGAGYIYHERIWDSGEPAGGPTEQWLARLAAEYNITIGAGFLEAEGDRFWNAYSLFGPDGTLAGRVRKASLPLFEGWYFEPSHDPKVIDTVLGRVAVGICNDVQTCGFLQEVTEAQPDLIVMPHSAPTPGLPGANLAFRWMYDGLLRGSAGRYSRALGVPVVMCNKVSFRTDLTPIPILPIWRVPWRFHGYSSVWDSDGSEHGELVDVEDALVAEVTLDDTCKRRPAPSGDRYWSFAPPVVGSVLGTLLRGLAHLGQFFYGRSERRRTAARRITDTP